MTPPNPNFMLMHFFWGGKILPNSPKIQNLASKFDVPKNDPKIQKNPENLTPPKTNMSPKKGLFQ